MLKFNCTPLEEDFIYPHIWKLRTLYQKYYFVYENVDPNFKSQNAQSKKLHQIELQIAKNSKSLEGSVYFDYKKMEGDFFSSSVMIS